MAAVFRPGWNPARKAKRWKTQAMKLATIGWMSLAAFAGVFGALQLDHLLSRSKDKPVEELPLQNELSIRPAGFESSTPTGAVDFRAAAKKVNASVVSVDEYQRVRRGFYDDEGADAKTGTGSGVIISADGVIVTNNHVVSSQNGAPVTQVKVRLSDQRTFTAKVLGKDPRADLAVLKIDAKNLTPIQLGSSSEVEVGQWVLAVGNPLGFDNTVSVGVVSSLKRDLPIGRSGLVNAIQTDAAINPGNSGGALTDVDGRLIGINSAIASSTGQSVGIGFAIPVDRVKAVVNDILKVGYARYAGLGITYNPDYDGALADPDFRYSFAQQFQLDETKIPQSGVVILGAAGSANSAGIQRGDVLVAIDDTPIDGSFALNKALMPRKPGDPAKVKVWSKGQTKTLDIKLQEVRSDPAPAQ